VACIALQRREIRWSEAERSDLSETEAALLRYLVTNRDRAVSREELLGRVWGIGTAGLETRAVDMPVARLRAKLKDPAGTDPAEVIVTVRAHGYMAGPGLAVREDPR
jgi:DNA-binding response OmpR family regulator